MRTNFFNSSALWRVIFVKYLFMKKNSHFKKNHKSFSSHKRKIYLQSEFQRFCLDSPTILFCLRHNEECTFPIFFDDFKYFILLRMFILLQAFWILIVLSSNFDPQSYYIQLKTGILSASLSFMKQRMRRINNHDYVSGPVPKMHSPVPKRHKICDHVCTLHIKHWFGLLSHVAL